MAKGSIFCVALAVLVVCSGHALALSNGKPNTPERIGYCRSQLIKCVKKGDDACTKENPRPGAERNTCVNGAILACQGMFGSGKKSDCETTKLIYRPRVKFPNGQIYAPK